MTMPPHTTTQHPGPCAVECPSSMARPAAFRHPVTTRETSRFSTDRRNEEATISLAVDRAAGGHALVWSGCDQNGAGL